MLEYLRRGLDRLITVGNARLWSFNSKMKLQHLTYLLAVLAACSAHSLQGSTTKDLDHPHIDCGMKLARMLAAVCGYGNKKLGFGERLYPIPYKFQKHDLPLFKYRESQYDLLPRKTPTESNYWPLQKTDSAEWARRMTESRRNWPNTYYYSYVAPQKTKAMESKDWPSLQEFVDWPRMTPLRTMDLDLPSKNAGRSIHECCDQLCTMDELVSYCY